jgi:hypothetical protein
MPIETLLVKKWSISSGGDIGQGLGYSDFVIIGAFSCYNRVPLTFGTRVPVTTTKVRGTRLFGDLELLGGRTGNHH